MTTAKPSVSLRRTADENGQEDSFHSGATRIGKWIFTPPSMGWGGTRNATLGHEDLEIDLRYSSTIFEDFLRTMSVIQVEFGRRLGNTAASAAAADECSGSSSRV
ncbi:hypothetical protein BGK67_31455 [Streptomyces subrutilus]|uniref:Uncharacterized protein n=1 Tax=Streptomyces subrutilus TaxID=36818 RepID=A0A1E5Q090_9ACTN|nr:hypothetical protein BGK67_31455 [Streptomyces subrutilus]